MSSSLDHGFPLGAADKLNGSQGPSAQILSKGRTMDKEPRPVGVSEEPVSFTLSQPPSELFPTMAF